MVEVGQVYLPQGVRGTPCCFSLPHCPVKWGAPPLCGAEPGFHCCCPGMHGMTLQRCSASLPLNLPPQRELDHPSPGVGAEKSL